MKTNKKYMKVALELAKKAQEEGEVPVGAVIVQEKQIIAKAYNQKEKECIAIRHAEMIAIEEASKKKGDWRLDDCIMYTSLEPCVMCKGAIMESRIKKVIYAAKDVGRNVNSDTNICQISDSTLVNESTEILKRFFANMRK